MLYHEQREARAQRKAALRAAKQQRRESIRNERLALAIARIQPGHRPSAYNCILWQGDNSPVDWGTCKICPAEKQEVF